MENQNNNPKINIGELSKKNIFVGAIIVFATMISLFVSSKYFFGNILYQFENEDGAYLFQDLVNQGHYAYSEKVGWIMLGSGSTQESIIEDTLRFVQTKSGAYFRGLAYSPTIGYISFGGNKGFFDNDGRYYPSPSSQTADKYGVNALKVNKDINMDNGTLTGKAIYQLEGYAYSEGAGYIYFGDGTSSYTGVYLTDDGRFVGYSYSPSFGLVYFGPTNYVSTPKLTEMTGSNLIAIDVPTGGNAKVTQSGSYLFITWDPIIDPTTGLPYKDMIYALWKNTGSTIDKGIAINVYSGKDLSYLDTNVLPGHSYSYHVTYIMNGKKIYVADIGSGNVGLIKDDDGDGNEEFLDSPIVYGTCWSNKEAYLGYCDTIALYVTGVTADTIGFKLYTNPYNSIPAATVRLADTSTFSGTFGYNENNFKYTFGNSPLNKPEYKYIFLIKNAIDGEHIPVGNYEFYLTALLNRNGGEVETSLIDDENRISIYSPDPNQVGYVLTYDPPLPKNTYIIGDKFRVKMNGKKDTTGSINTLKDKYGPEWFQTPNHSALWTGTGYTLSEFNGGYYVTVSKDKVKEEVISKIKNDGGNEFNTSSGMAFYTMADNLGTPYSGYLPKYLYITGDKSMVQHPEKYYVDTIEGQVIAFTGYYANMGLYNIKLSAYNTTISDANTSKAFQLKWNEISGIAGGIGIYDVLVSTGSDYTSIKNTSLKFTDKNGQNILFGDSNTGVYISNITTGINYKFKVTASIYKNAGTLLYQTISNAVEISIPQSVGVNFIVIREGTGGNALNPWGNDYIYDPNYGSNPQGGSINPAHILRTEVKGILNKLGGKIFVLNSLTGGENTISINPHGVLSGTSGNGEYTFNFEPDKSYDIEIKASGYATFKATYANGELKLGSGAGMSYNKTDNIYVIGIPLKGDVSSPSDIIKLNAGQCSETNNCIGTPDGMITKEDDAIWSWYATDRRKGTMEHFRTDGKYKFKYANIGDVSSPSDIAKLNAGQCSETVNCIGNSDTIITKEDDAIWSWYATDRRKGTMEHLRIDGKYKFK